MKKVVSISLAVCSLSLFPIKGSIAQTPTVTEETSEQSKKPARSDKYAKTRQEIKDLLINLEKAVLSQNIDHFSSYLHSDVMNVNEATKEVFKGKKAVIAQTKKRFKQFAPGGATPLKSFDIRKLSFEFKDDKVVVHYEAYAELGGTKGGTLFSEITEVFAREKGDWKSYRYFCHWTDDSGKNLDDGKIVAERYVKLKGGVETLLVSLHSLKNLGHDVRRARRAVNEYSKEVSRKKLVVVAPANEVGPIIAESEDPADKYLPARKSHLYLYLREMDSLLEIMKDDVDSFESGALTLVFREDIKSDMNKLIKDWSARVKAASKLCKQLKKATKKDIDDHEGLISQAKSLKSEIEELRKIQKKMVRTFRKPSKIIW